ncbi:MAG: hypothetical protein WCB19_03740 [Thermoplasmata archaeon]
MPVRKEKVERVFLTCARCEYEWEPMRPDDLPIVCPKCKSHQWNEVEKVPA